MSLTSAESSVLQWNHCKALINIYPNNRNGREIKMMKLKMSWLTLDTHEKLSYKNSVLTIPKVLLLAKTITVAIVQLNSIVDGTNIHPVLHISVWNFTSIKWQNMVIVKKYVFQSKINCYWWNLDRVQLFSFPYSSIYTPLASITIISLDNFFNYLQLNPNQPMQSIIIAFQT